MQTRFGSFVLDSTMNAHAMATFGGVCQDAGSMSTPLVQAWQIVWRVNWGRKQEVQI